jgi:hypothetical protein
MRKENVVVKKLIKGVLKKDTPHKYVNLATGEVEFSLLGCIRASVINNRLCFEHLKHWRTVKRYEKLVYRKEVR